MSMEKGGANMAWEKRSKMLTMRVAPSTYETFRRLDWRRFHCKTSDADIFEFLMKLLDDANAIEDIRCAMYSYVFGNRDLEIEIKIHEK